MVIDWYAVLAGDDGNRLQPAASNAEVGRAEALLDAVFPADLRALYLATDGVFDQPGQWFVVWPLADVVTRNRQSWAEESAARRRLVGFGDDGTGAPFCVPRDGTAGVFAWNPIDQHAYRLADTAEEFWRGWSGQSRPSIE
ncbi:MAG TPA: SMI1/KNR4 family protein [Micromonosporaceae bacterium]|nr:SMI1/KNR4 family protein [Micromonosporaceae bacterium]